MCMQLRVRQWYLRKSVLDRSTVIPEWRVETTFTWELGRGIYYYVGGGRSCGRRLLP